MAVVTQKKRILFILSSFFATSVASDPWLQGNKCGPYNPLPDGRPGQCNPQAEGFCCSRSGWCGKSPIHCACTNCTDFRMACPAPFKQVGEQCLKVVEEEKTWPQALAACQDLGGQLTQLQDTQDIEDHIVKNLRKGGKVFWVGAEWKKEDEHFRWITSDTEVINWESGKPNTGSMNHGTEHCVGLKGSYNGKFNDEDCETSRPFICEVEPWSIISKSESTTTEQVSASNNHSDSYDFTPVIIGVIISALLIVVCTIAFICLKKIKNKVHQGQHLGDLPIQLSDPGMGSRHESVNSLYGTVCGSTEAQIPNRGSQHNSENSLYGAVVERDA